MMRYGLIPRTAAPAGEGAEGAAGADGAAAGGGSAGGAKAKPANTNEVSVLTLNVRAVNLQRIKQEANGAIAYDLEKLAKSSPLFDASETQLSGQLEQVEDSTPTFSFPLKVKLKRPIKL